MPAATLTIRRAGPDDAEAIASVHVASWRESYRELIPEAVLTALSVAERAARWRSILSGGGGGRSSAYVAEIEGEVIGFGSCGPQRDPGLERRGFTGEISALYVRTLELDNVRENLERGDADFILAPIGTLPDTLMSATISSSRLCCIVARQHPWIGDTLSAEEFGRAGHVVLSLGGGNSQPIGEQIVDDRLGESGQRRTAVVRVASGLAIPAIVAETDLIATVPELLAESAARSLPIRILPFPLSGPETDMSVVWHARSHGDAGSRWIRSVLRKLSVAPFAIHAD